MITAPAPPPHRDAAPRTPAEPLAAPPEVPEPSPRSRVVVPIAVVLCLASLGAGVYSLGVAPMLAARADLRAQTQDRAAENPSVPVVRAAPGKALSTIRLPARLVALQDTSVYPREGGYIREINADIGDAVAEGQVLAVIDTPVLDQQIAEALSAINVAESRLAEAVAQAAQSDAQLRRLLSVQDARAVSAQTIDDAKAKSDADLASVGAAEATLQSARVSRQRLEEQKAFATIRAPFKGEITSRDFDVGALVIADKTDTARPLFRITSRDELRVFVDAPQSAALAVAPGQDIAVTVAEIPGRKFLGKVVRASAALDANQRTRLVEGRLPNHDHALLPGMFTEVTFDVPRPDAPVVLPGEAMLIRDGKPAIAVVTSDGTLEYRTVDVSRDLGATVDIARGVEPGELVVINMTRQLDPGAKVRAVERK